jgi:hypothetical protein
VPLPLRLLLVVAAIEAVAWTVAIAPLNGPDESAHYSYVQYLAETGHKPEFAAGTGIVSQETGTALNAFNLYALVGRVDARPFWSAADQKAFARYEASAPRSQRSDGSGPNSVAKNPPLYYAYQAIPYRLTSGAGFIGRLFALRLANGLLFLVTVALTWLLAAELFRSVLLRTVATAAVALQPMLAFMSGVVNPDTGLTTIWAAFLLVAVRLVLRGPTTRRVVGLVALCAASVLTHGRGLPLAPITLLALALAWWRHRPPLRRGAIWLGGGLLVLVAGFATYRLLLSGSSGGGVYGGEVNFAPGFNVKQFIDYVWQFYFPKLPGMQVKLGPEYGFRQMFIERYLAGSFGSLEVRYPDTVYRLVELAADAGIIALVYGLVARRHVLRPRWDVLLLLAATVVACVGFLHLASYRAMVGGGMDPLIVGRYLLPLTPIFGLAVAFVVGLLRPAWRPYGAAAVLTVGLLLQLAGLGLTAARFYG